MWAITHLHLQSPIRIPKPVKNSVSENSHVLAFDAKTASFIFSTFDLQSKKERDEKIEANISLFLWLPISNPLNP